jgi:hypothetical protein
MYYFLGRSEIENYTNLAIYEYMKADGRLEHMDLTGIKGTVMAMMAGFCLRNKLLNKKLPEPTTKQAKRLSSSTKNTQ